MRKPRVSRDRYIEDESVDLTPLIDVVFIMLIFFICTTSFVKESGVEIERPTAASGEAKGDSGIIYVGIDASERVWVDNAPVDIKMLRARLERMKAEVSQPSIVVQADAAVATGRLLAVMDQARLAGISQIAVATKSGE